jgi:two-component system response regulator AtoC
VLLRAIQESEFERVGGVKTIHVDVRIIAASNRDLEADIKARRFREDLFYRLNVVPIQLPPLRDRLGDLPALIEHFVVRCNERLGKAVSGFSDDALAALARYGWPGNIRELENLVERMVLFASTPVIEVDSLPDAFLDASRGSDVGPTDGRRGPEAGDVAPDDAARTDARAAERASARTADKLDSDEPRDNDELDPQGEQVDAKLIRLPLASLGFDLKEAVRAGSRMVEEALISEALSQTQGNVTRSARLLGISRRSLQSKMKELGLRGGEGEGPGRGP